MAGIGFELQRVLRRGGIGSLIQVAFAGVLIVAGPWLLSIAGIFFITRFAAPALHEGQRLFISIVVYGYAFSLVLFGGFHYLFTRVVADQIYEERYREAGASLVAFSLGVVVVAAVAAGIVISRADLGFLSHPTLFRIASAGLFAVINLLWIVMIFVSLLKRFAGILLAYLGGMTVSVGAAVFLGRIWGLGGAMAGFAVGQLVAALSLGSLLVGKYRPAGFSRFPRLLLRYARRYRYLFLSGLFYFWGIWVDKLVYWFALGSSSNGTFFRLYDPYDVPVYLASLTMIPGLVYFVVVLETDFYLELMSFLKSLQTGTLTRIQERKYALRSLLQRGLWEQSLFQGVITLALLFLASELLPLLGVGASAAAVFRILLIAVYFHFLMLTLITFLLYMELFLRAFLCALAFFVLNLGGSLATALLHATALAGASYLLAALAASIIGYLFLDSGARHLERNVLARYSGT